ncbi:hypothetical protein BC828DRAFT_436073 [Blastocladiella britannica]|nr:hypothetical protein BC828DRAFT_436073 [Blastocladiella britannica]
MDSSLPRSSTGDTDSSGGTSPPSNKSASHPHVTAALDSTPVIGHPVHSTSGPLQRSHENSSPTPQRRAGSASSNHSQDTHGPLGRRPGSATAVTSSSGGVSAVNGGHHDGTTGSGASDHVVAATPVREMRGRRISEPNRPARGGSQGMASVAPTLPSVTSSTLGRPRGATTSASGAATPSAMGSVLGSMFTSGIRAHSPSIPSGLSKVVYGSSNAVGVTDVSIGEEDDPCENSTAAADKGGTHTPPGIPPLTNGFTGPAPSSQTGGTATTIPPGGTLPQAYSVGSQRDFESLFGASEGNGGRSSTVTGSDNTGSSSHPLAPRRAGTAEPTDAQKQPSIRVISKLLSLSRRVSKSSTASHDEGDSSGNTGGGDSTSTDGGGAVANGIATGPRVRRRASSIMSGIANMAAAATSNTTARTDPPSVDESASGGGGNGSNTNGALRTRGRVASLTSGLVLCDEPAGVSNSNSVLGRSGGAATVGPTPDLVRIPESEAQSSMAELASGSMSGGLDLAEDASVRQITGVVSNLFAGRSRALDDPQLRSLRNAIRRQGAAALAQQQQQQHGFGNVVSTAMGQPRMPAGAAGATGTTNASGSNGFDTSGGIVHARGGMSESELGTAVPMANAESAPFSGSGQIPQNSATWKNGLMNATSGSSTFSLGSRVVGAATSAVTAVVQRAAGLAHPEGSAPVTPHGSANSVGTNGGGSRDAIAIGAQQHQQQQQLVSPPKGGNSGIRERASTTATLVMKHRTRARSLSRGSRQQQAGAYQSANAVTAAAATAAAVSGSASGTGSDPLSTMSSGSIPLSNHTAPGGPPPYGGSTDVMHEYTAGAAAAVAGAGPLRPSSPAAMLAGSPHSSAHGSKSSSRPTLPHLDSSSSTGGIAAGGSRLPVGPISAIPPSPQPLSRSPSGAGLVQLLSGGGPSMGTGSRRKSSSASSSSGPTTVPQSVKSGLHISGPPGAASAAAAATAVPNAMASAGPSIPSLFGSDDKRTGNPLHPKIKLHTPDHVDFADGITSESATGSTMGMNMLGRGAPKPLTSKSDHGGPAGAGHGSSTYSVAVPNLLAAKNPFNALKLPEELEELYQIYFYHQNKSIFESLVIQTLTLNAAFLAWNLYSYPQYSMLMVPGPALGFVITLIAGIWLRFGNNESDLSFANLIVGASLGAVLLSNNLLRDLCFVPSPYWDNVLHLNQTLFCGFVYWMLRAPLHHRCVVGWLFTVCQIIIDALGTCHRSVLASNILIYCLGNIIGMFFAFFSEMTNRNAFLRTREVYKHQGKLHLAKEQSEALLRMVLPARVIEELKRGVDGKEYLSGRSGFQELHRVTILFADIVGFTEFSSKVSATKLVLVLSDMFAEIDNVTESLGLEKIKTIGDCYQCCGGVPEPVANDLEAGAWAQRMCMLGIEIIQGVNKTARRIKYPLRVRVGIHTGSVMAGIMGISKLKYDVWSKDVDIASLMEQSATPDIPHISLATYNYMVQSGHDSGMTLVTAPNVASEGDEVIKTFNVSEYTFPKFVDGAVVSVIHPLPSMVVATAPPTSSAAAAHGTTAPPEKACMAPKSGSDQGLNPGAGLAATAITDRRPSELPPSPAKPAAAVSPSLEQPICVAGGKALHPRSASNNASGQPGIIEEGGDSVTGSASVAGTGGASGGGASGGGTAAGNSQKAIAAFLSPSDDDGLQLDDPRALRESVQAQQRLFADFEKHLHPYLGTFRDGKMEEDYKNDYMEHHGMDLVYAIALLILNNVVFICASSLVLSPMALGHALSAVETLIVIAIVTVIGMRYRKRAGTQISIQEKHVSGLWIGSERELGSIDSVAKFTRWHAWRPNTVALVVLVLHMVGDVRRVFTSDVLFPSYQFSAFILLQFSTTLFVGLRMRQLSLLSFMFIPVFAALYWVKLYTLFGQVPSVTADLVQPALSFLVSGLMVYTTNKAMDLQFRRNFQMKRFLEGKLQEIRTVQRDTERLLLNIFPLDVAQRLRLNPTLRIADSFEDVSVIFGYISNFDTLDLPPALALKLLNEVICDIDELCVRHHVEKIKTIGTKYLAMTKDEKDLQPHAVRMAEFALDLRLVISNYNDQFFSHMYCNNFSCRIGINCGPVVAGVIGTSKYSFDVWGDAVNVSSRMESNGQDNMIHVSQSTFEHLNAFYEFQPRGQVPIKGKGLMSTYYLLNRRKPPGAKSSASDTMQKSVLVDAISPF